MTTVVPISELKQRTGQVLNQAVVDRQDVIIERYGQEYAVILSRSRYQELLDAARAGVYQRTLAAQREVYEATADIPEAEVADIVATALDASRRESAAAKRERFRKKLLDAGMLSTAHHPPAGTVLLSPEELLRLGTLPPGTRPTDELIDEDRGQW
jgi:prevent-host-death family protein